MAGFGFIGTGNMGGALARAARRSLPPEKIYLANRTAAKAEKLAEELGCRVVSNQTVAKEADYIVLGVKPQMMAGVLSDIASELAQRKSRFILVSMAAGLRISQIQEMAGGNYPVIRIMPNIPVKIGEGMILYTLGKEIAQTEVNTFLEGMSGAGRFSLIEEKMMDAGSAVAGCGPAFVALFIEALADGAVACGLPREKAVEQAAQMIQGTARLILDTKESPAVLKDTVCSPGGTTIQGIRKLEENGFRAAVINAVIAACEKSANLA